MEFGWRRETKTAFKKLSLHSSEERRSPPNLIVLYPWLSVCSPNRFPFLPWGYFLNCFLLSLSALQQRARPQSRGNAGNAASSQMKPVSHFLLNLTSTLDCGEDQRLGCVRVGPDLGTCAELGLLQCPPQDCKDPWCKAQPSSAFCLRHPLPAMGPCLSHGSSFWVLTAFGIRKYPLPCYTFLKMRLILFPLSYIKTGLIIYLFIYFLPSLPKVWFF